MRTVDYSKPFQVFSCCDALLSGDQEITIKNQRFLGRGGQGEVNAVKVYRNAGQSEAELLADKTCQIIDNIELTKRALRAFMSEYFLAHDLSHPNILQYKYLIRKFSAGSRVHEIHMITELLKGGDLDTFISSSKEPITLDKIKHFGGQLISGIKFIHENLIVHQDLKPLNILLAEDKRSIKIIDFGLYSESLKT